MKRLILFAALIFALPLRPSLDAQILNGGFETWQSPVYPSDWFSNNSSTDTTVTQSSDAHSGSFAAKGANVPFYSVVLGPTLSAGSNSTGFTISARYSSLTGYYKYTCVGGDSLWMQILLYKSDNPVGAGVFTIATTVGSYTQFTIPISYLSGDVPDNAKIEFTIVPGPSSALHLGSYFLIDDVSFGPSTVVSEIAKPVPTTFNLAQNYPNPFNPSTTIEFSIPQNGRVKLKVYDILGNEVATLVDREMSAGHYSATWNAKNNSSGVYFYRLTAGSSTEIKRLILMK
ncbi:MAG TPA: T9SS type A sorting domain-containing protein [Bacteroidota bacterium]|nr:T9SS type A sorting domain-containing protein [Bacteroidota bacterium]